MKLTAQQIYESAALARRLAREQMPARMAMLVERNLRLLQVEFAGIEKMVQGTMRKHGTVTPGDRPGEERVSVAPENIAAVNAELADAMREEFDVDVRLIDLDELPALTLSPEDVRTGGWLFKQEE